MAQSSEMDETEIPSVEYEDRGIPNDQDIKWIQQYYADIEADRANDARQKEASDRLEKERLSRLNGTEDDDTSSSSSDSDSDLDDVNDAKVATTHKIGSNGKFENGEKIQDASNTRSQPDNEPIATSVAGDKQQEVEAQPSEASNELEMTGTEHHILSQPKPDAAAIIETVTAHTEPSNPAVQPSAAADSMAAELLAKYKSEPEKAADNADSDDSSSIDSDSSDDSDIPRLNHEELEAMILAEDGGGKKDYNPEMENAEPAPKFPAIVVNDKSEIEPVGEMHAFVDDSLHFWQLADQEQSEDNDRILLEGSVICLEDLRVLGGVFDMMGPMRAKKLYQIKYDKTKLQEIKSWSLTRGTKVYRVVPHSTWGHVNQFTAGDEAFDEVYEGDDDMQDIDDAEVLMRRAQDVARGGRGGQKGARERGRGRGRGDRRGQGHPRGQNQFRGGRGSHGPNYPDRSLDQSTANASTYNHPGHPYPPYVAPTPQAQPGITPQHFQALLMNLQQQQHQRTQQGNAPMPPQPYINQGFAQQPAFNPFAAWGANMAAQGQMPQMPPLPPMPPMPQVTPMPQYGGWQQANSQPAQSQTNPYYPQPSVPQFGGGLPVAQGNQNRADQRGRGRGRGRGAGTRPRHPDDPPEW